MCMVEENNVFPKMSRYTREGRKRFVMSNTANLQMPISKEKGTSLPNQPEQLTIPKNWKCWRNERISKYAWTMKLNQ